MHDVIKNKNRIYPQIGGTLYIIEVHGIKSFYKIQHQSKILRAIESTPYHVLHADVNVSFVKVVHVE